MKPSSWPSRILFGIVVLFLAFDSISHIMAPAPVVEAFTRLGIPMSRAIALGVIQLACLAVYAVPQTAILGAILLTGWLGGATAIHMRAGSTPFEMIFPEIIGVMMWGALYLRDARLRALIPVQRAP
ncbi:MAG: hypothetical protein JWO05_2979 [Gemmatimonadetes bacterium]|nr:hypothetical protein [Gemmatimonadota bacterium]